MKFLEWVEQAGSIELVAIATPEIDAAELAHWELAKRHMTRRGKKTTAELALADYYDTWGGYDRSD